jgi:competence protein ComEC
LKNNPLATICIFFCLGIWTAKLVHIPLFFVYVGCIACLLAALAGLKRAILFSVSLGAAIFLAGFIHLQNSQTYPTHHISNFVSDEGQKVYLMGKVVSNPEVSRTYYGSPKAVFTFRARDLKFVTPVIARLSDSSAEAISKDEVTCPPREMQGRRASVAPSGLPRNDDNRWQAVQGLIKVTLYGERQLQYGDKLLLQGSLVRPPGLRNPGGFNYREYLANQNIFGTLKVKEKGTFLPLSGDSSCVIARSTANGVAGGLRPFGAGNDVLLKAIFQFKQKLHNIIYQHLEPGQAALLSAILLGERENLPRETKDMFVKTGTIHILAISGLHVGLLALIVLACLRFLRLGRRMSIIMTVFILIGYAALSGGRPSVVRATVMAVIVFAGLLINRELKIYNCLGLAALAILLFNPLYLFDAGFILSFVSVISIACFTPKIERALSARLVSKPTGLPAAAAAKQEQRSLLSRSLSHLIRAFSVSLSAWLGIAPFTALYFNIVTPIAVLANLIVIPCLLLIVSTGICFLIFASLWAPLGSIFAQTCWLLLLGLSGLTSWITKIPLSFFNSPAPGIFFFLIYYLLLLLIVNYKRLNISPAKVGIVLLLAANILAWKPMFKTASDKLRVTFLDVGLGDAVFIEFPYSGRTMLIDGGPGGENDAGRWAILPFLWNKGIGRIDALVLTHPDDDHLGGLVSVLKNIKVNYVFDNGMPKESIGYNNYKTQVAKKVPHYRILKRAEQIIGFPRAELLVLYPQQPFLLGTGADTNNNSVVLKLVYKDVSFIFCADIQKQAIAGLLPYGPLLKSTVLKVPHHGSDEEEEEDYLFQAVSARIAVISVGKDNRFSFPAPEVINRLKRVGTEVYATSDNGAVTVSTDGCDVWVETMN